MQYTHTALVAALVAVHAPSNEDVLPPEAFMLLGGLGRLDPEAQYVVYDLEEAAGTLLPSEELLAKLQPSAEQPSVELAVWSGETPGSWGYGDLYEISTPAGLGLRYTVAGSAGQSAGTIWVVPVTDEYPAVNAI